MAALVWLLIPLMGVLVAALWGSWAARRRTGAGGVMDVSGVRSHEAFRAAMERPLRSRRSRWLRRRRARPTPRPVAMRSTEPSAAPAQGSPAPADG